MGILKRTKSFWREKRGSGSQRPAPLPSLSEVQVPALPALQAIPQRQYLKKQQEPAQCITAEKIRELRGLIRHKYTLDLEIWEQRGVKEFKRDHCKENMRRSDAALVVIKQTLHDWDRREFFTSDDEYIKFREIKDRMMSGKKVIWEQTPPWDIVKQHNVPVRPPYEMNGRPPSAVPEWGGSYDYPPPAKQPYPRAVSDPEYPGKRLVRSSQQAQGIRSALQNHQRVVSAPQHIQRFPAPQQSYQGLTAEMSSPRYQ